MSETLRPLALQVPVASPAARLLGGHLASLPRSLGLQLCSQRWPRTLPSRARLGLRQFVPRAGGAAAPGGKHKLEGLRPRAS